MVFDSRGINETSKRNANTHWSAAVGGVSNQV